MRHLPFTLYSSKQLASGDKITPNSGVHIRSVQACPRVKINTLKRQLRWALVYLKENDRKVFRPYKDKLFDLDHAITSNLEL
jgi:hypothetical protein